MSHVHRTRLFLPKNPNGTLILLWCGFGGRIWQTKRLITALTRRGYTVRAYDFSSTILSGGNPQELIEVTDEMVAEAERQSSEWNGETILFGISLGALLSLNVLRRSNCIAKAVGITGGNIVTAAKNSAPKSWRQSDEELSELWKDVNMFTDPQLLKGKKMVFVLPLQDKFIDPEEVKRELQTQTAAGNAFFCIEKPSSGHIDAIFDETVLHPKRTLSYLAMLDTDVRRST